MSNFVFEGKRNCSSLIVKEIQNLKEIIFELIKFQNPSYSRKLCDDLKYILAAEKSNLEFEEVCHGIHKELQLLNEELILARESYIGTKTDISTIFTPEIKDLLIIKQQKEMEDRDLLQPLDKFIIEQPSECVIIDVEHFKCQCGKILPNNKLFLEHQKLHAGRPRNQFHPCPHPDCGRYFTRPCLLKQHLLSHQGKMPFTCEICKKGFCAKRNLKVHLRIHSGEKPFKCDLCDKAFRYHSSMDRHKKLHSGGFPANRCHYCEKTFQSKSYLTTHIRIHTGEKPFQCEICGKAFYSNTHVVSHQKTVHSDFKPFKCSYCCKTFAQKHTFTFHVKAHLHKHNNPHAAQFVNK